ncbi:replication factor RFC1 C terminal domain-containing protein [Lactarius psammicola]|nr:replication factor RFC1 C terminal domain-containing protein [Lactarius psammicola]
MSHPGKKSPGKKSMGTNPDSSQQDLRSFFGAGRAPTAGSSQKAASQRQQIVISASEDEAPPSPVKKVVRASGSATREHSALPTASLKRKAHRILLSSDDEEDVEEATPPPKKKPAVAPAPKTSREQAVQQQSKRSTSSKVKRKKKVSDYESSADEGTADSDSDLMDVDEDEKVEKKTVANAKKNTKPTNTASTGKGRVKVSKEDSLKVEHEDKDSSNPKPKFNWAAAKAARMTRPPNPDPKPVPPAAASDCLAGLSFVFTGELSSFSREDAIDIAKRFCARVVGQPSSKTDYVVLGDNAGPSKVAAIKKHNLKTLSEDEFLNLIATRKGPGDGKGLSEKEKKKREKEEKAIRDSAKEMEAREKATKAAGSKLDRGVRTVDPKTQLWTDRYAPQTMKEICGNKGQVEKLQQWLNDWSNSLKANFKKPGKNGMNNFRGTTSAHMCAKLAGFTPIELNASDARSKKLVENSTNIHNTSLDGWMGGGERTNAAGIIITDRSCLIMDEVDGMSAGDRGGVGALAALIRKTKVPIICIANDRSAPKMKPLMNGTFSLPFRKPDANQIRSRIMTIVFKEKMQIPANVIDELITGVGSDIRQVLNMLSTWKLHNETMDFEEGKMLAKANEKYSVMTPFNIIQKILGPYMFSATSRDTLNDKIELYFHDYSFVPLFIQENYLKTNPSRVRDVEGPKKALKQLKLMERAAESISDGDLVDSLIHGPEQHWSLMPTHAVLSTVRPSSFLYGPGSGYGGPNAMTFPQWLGQNSKQNKLGRALGDVQIRMRLKVSSDRSETRLSYLPAMFPLIVKPLMEMGSSAVDDVIGCMDDYYISREDWDTIVELGLGEQKDDVVLKKIAAATKTALTRKYNSQDHPIPFHKAQDLGKVPKKLAGGPAPDLEEAFDVDDTLEDADDDKKGDDPDDIKHDKLIQEAKGKKKAATTKGKGAGKAKR